MSQTHGESEPGHGRFIAVSGKVANLSAKNLARISVYLTENGQVVLEAPISVGGGFQFEVARKMAESARARLVLGPRRLDAQGLGEHPQLPSVSLASARRGSNDAVVENFEAAELSDEIVDPWWIWCREYTISGTLDTAAGCPVAGAQVTIYNVVTTSSGLTRVPIVTVPVGADGKFSAAFNWCERICLWPCWPRWWGCWPWWWELDILSVIERIEGQIATRPAPGSPNVLPRLSAPMRQPAAEDLAVGQAFAANRRGVAQPDPARTALIAAKLTNPAIRELFPWWWWCCDNPNIVFSAYQLGQTIVDEDPNASTRWCFASGQSVTLVAGAQAVGVCPSTAGGPPNTFVWTSVGGAGSLQALVPKISHGYADGMAGSDASNMPFAGQLSLMGNLGSNVVCYQVTARAWGGDGNPARGGTPPGAGLPLVLPYALTETAFILRANNTFDWPTVTMGPFTLGTTENLYMNPAQRQAATPPTAVGQIGAFPTLNPGDQFLGWSNPNLILVANAGDLLGGAPVGGVDLSLNAYDGSANLLSLLTDVPLTLMVDTTPLDAPTAGFLTLVGVYNADGSAATTTISGVCPAYQISSATGYVVLQTNVSDANGHLGGYYIATQYGNGTLPPVITQPSSRDYDNPGAISAWGGGSPPNGYGTLSGYQVPNDGPYVAPSAANPQPQNWSYVGGGDRIQITVDTSCCYDFQLWGAKRVTDGSTFACPFGELTYQTVNIVVAGS
jgi:hypothetical protein